MFVLVQNPFLFEKLYCESDVLYSIGDTVIIEDDAKEFIYASVSGVQDAFPDDYKKEVKNIIRKATAEDEARNQECILRAKDALQYCKQEIRNQMLPMKLLSVEMLFNMSKMIFYFTAPDRIDFRGLVRSLVERYKERIELKQVGIRHEVQLLGGIGSCGRSCCCTTFLKNSTSVSVKVAKQSNINLSMNKVSGLCGRLSCCLPYEAER